MTIDDIRHGLATCYNRPAELQWIRIRIEEAYNDGYKAGYEQGLTDMAIRNTETELKQIEKQTPS